MPLFYVDTSALVKRYHVELGSEWIDRLFADPDAALVIADFAITELTSALDRKCQDGALSPDGLTQILAHSIHECFYCNRRDAATTSLAVSFARPGVQARPS